VPAAVPERPAIPRGKFIGKRLATMATTPITS
jgi:hypothetical protein